MGGCPILPHPQFPRVREMLLAKGEEEARIKIPSEAGAWRKTAQGVGVIRRGKRGGGRRRRCLGADE